MKTSKSKGLISYPLGHNRVTAESGWGGGVKGMRCLSDYLPLSSLTAATGFPSQVNRNVHIIFNSSANNFNSFANKINPGTTRMFRRVLDKIGHSFADFVASGVVKMWCFLINYGQNVVCEQLNIHLPTRAGRCCELIVCNSAVDNTRQKYRLIFA